jgi:hypothetical protein
MFGHNGQMKDNEWAGIGNHNSAEFWEYDTRTGRRLNLDPVDQVSISNYATFSDNPIVNSDHDGDNPFFGAIIGMGLDIATQGIMMHMGLQEEFSWSSVLISGASGAIGVGIGAKVAKIGTCVGASHVSRKRLPKGTFARGMQ